MKKKILFVTILLLVAIYFLVVSVFVSKREHLQKVAGVQVRIKNPEARFVREKDVAKVFRTKGGGWKRLNNLHEQKLEEEMKKNKYIENVQIFYTADKHYIVEIEQRKPILRVESSSQSFYLDKNGIILPTGSRYATRVHIYRGDITENFAKHDLLKFQNYIEQDSYWSEMIDYIVVKEKELDLYLRMKGAKVKFGKVEDIVSKFRKLQVFIDKIARHKGLEVYKAIDLRFEEQIVCEKK